MSWWLKTNSALLKISTQLIMRDQEWIIKKFQAKMQRITTVHQVIHNNYKLPRCHMVEGVKGLVRTRDESYGGKKLHSSRVSHIGPITIITANTMVLGLLQDRVPHLCAGFEAVWPPTHHQRRAPGINAIAAPLDSHDGQLDGRHMTSSLGLRVSRLSKQEACEQVAIVCLTGRRAPWPLAANSLSNALLMVPAAAYKSSGPFPLSLIQYSLWRHYTIPFRPPPIHLFVSNGAVGGAPPRLQFWRWGGRTRASGMPRSARRCRIEAEVGFLCVVSTLYLQLILMLWSLDLDNR